jgi:hypothetical protein
VKRQACLGNAGLRLPRGSGIAAKNIRAFTPVFAGYAVNALMFDATVSSLLMTHQNRP